MRSLTTGAFWASAVAVVSTLSAQRGAPPESQRVRHLVYIATPGDNGTDNQSGVVVLDADKGYSFIKRIPYDLPASNSAIWSPSLVSSSSLPFNPGTTT